MSDNKPPSTLRKSIGELSPKLVDLTEDVLFGDVWERPQLSKRDRSLITCAALIATGRTEQMDFHFPNAIKNGVTQEELVEDDHAPRFLCRLAERDVCGEPHEGVARQQGDALIRGTRRRRTMPHVIVKLYAGKSEQQKMRLAEAVTKAVTATLNYGDESVSVAIEDVSPERWAEDVYKPDILGNPDKIYKKPGYDPFR
jgi:4-carboxymuconolactone decarboxylase